MFVISLLFVTLVTLVKIENSYGAKLPSYMSACRRYDPKLNECALKVAKAAAKTFSKGDAELNIPRLDPLEVKHIKTAAFGTNQDNGIKILFSDVIIKGLKDIDIKKMTVDVEKRKFNAKGNLNLSMESKYDLSGRLLVFPLVGKGKSLVNLRNVKMSYTFNYDIVKRDGVEYSKLTTDDMKYEVGEGTFQLDNLFNGDKVLGETTNRLLNENWREVLAELAPPVVNAIRNGFKKATEKFLDQIPYDDLLTIP